MLANLGVALSVHRSTGANLAIVLDGLARWHDDCAALAGRARASSAGALLSARLVAALPLVALPLLPAARAPILDGPGVISLVLGLALMALGMKWMKRLVPTAWHEPDLALMVATLAAAALAGGARLRPSLQAIACAVGGSADLTRAEKRVRLGQNWSGALQATGDPALARLGHLIERIERTGAPAGAALSDWADARSTQLATGFEARVARAPVKLVVPLTLCVLPAFGLVGVLPFLRALAAP
jgi:tight adherence protein B